MSQEFESPPRADVPASGRQVFAVGSDLAELCAEAVIVWSLVGVVRAWNASAERLYGRPAEAAVGQDIDALLAPPGFAPHPLARARVRSHGRWSGQLRRRAAQGGEQMVQVRWTLQVDAAGQPDAIIEFSQGLDQDEAVQRFKANEERYRDLFLRAPVPLMLADAHGVSQLVRELKAAGVTDTAGFLTGHPEFLDRALDIVSVADVNERAIAVFGARQASDLVGPVRPLWVDSPDTFLRALIARIDGAAYFAEETRMRTFDGRTVDILFSLAFPPPDQYAGAALMGLQDITDRRRAETQFEKLRSNLAHGARVSTLGELTASLAHELTQPLAAIATNGHATLGWLDKTPPNVGRARERALRIVADAHRAGEIIKRFRAMATNRAPEDFELSLNEVVQEALLFLRHDLDERGIAVSTDLADGLPMARGDRVQLQQVIVNLTINSMQALAQAASRRTAIKLHTYVDAGGRVGFSIHDTGPGIPEDHLDHIFAGFFTTKTEGMGMGLAICQSIIVAHGGELEVSNLADGGACFSFSLPAASEDHAGS